MSARLVAFSTLLLAILCTVAVAQNNALPAKSSLQQTQEVRPMVPAPEVPLNSKDAALLEQRGDSLRDQKDYLQAIDYYNAAIKLNSTAILHNKVGMAYLGLRRLDKATSSIKRAIRMDKKYAEAYNNLGAIYHLKQKYNNAIKNYQKAIALNDDSASFHSNLGTSYLEKKDFEHGLREYQRAYQLDPEVFERSSRSGITARLSSPEDRARFSYYLARVFAQAGNADKALLYLRKAMEDGYPEIDNVYKDAEFAGLRKDERFTELMAARPTSIQQ